MGDVMSDTNWVRSDDWVGTEIDGSFVMVSVESGKYVALNETAHAIWTALETPQDDSAISHYLGERFDVGSAEGYDVAVRDALEKMQTMGLIDRG